MSSASGRGGKRNATKEPAEFPSDTLRFPFLSAPARRALERAKIHTLAQLSQYTEKGILALHGVGPSSLPKMRAALKNEKLTFRKESFFADQPLRR